MSIHHHTNTVEHHKTVFVAKFNHDVTKMKMAPSAARIQKVDLDAQSFKFQNENAKYT